MSDKQTRTPVFPAIKRGLACKCPACDNVSSFNGYLEIRNECSLCGENLSHHRADDFPPCLTIFIVGHIMVGLILIVERSTNISTGVHLTIWIPLAIPFSPVLLRPLKDAATGMQWATRMHGFDSGNNFNQDSDEDRLD